MATPTTKQRTAKTTNPIRSMSIGKMASCSFVTTMRLPLSKTQPTKRLERGLSLISAYCHQLVRGGFDEALADIRKLAKCVTPTR